jgi:hypothetical protein
MLYTHELLELMVARIATIVEQRHDYSLGGKQVVTTMQFWMFWMLTGLPLSFRPETRTPFVVSRTASTTNLFIHIALPRRTG